MRDYPALRALIRTILESKTPRVSDLSQEDIILVIEDILGREPLGSYTEKLAGQNLTVYIRGGAVTGQFKGKTESSWSDLSGVAAEIRQSSLPDSVGDITFSFEILKPENRPDYLDYAIGGKTVVVEFTGALTKEMARVLNTSQRRLKFLTKEDITKRPRPLSAATAETMRDHLNALTTQKKVTKEKKEQIESDISAALVEIFGESIFGGAPEGIFVTGTSKSFKIPEKTYADVQRLSAPIYAVFSEKGKIPMNVIYDRFAAISSGAQPNPESDGIWRDLKRYLTAAAAGFSPGYMTFFSPSEARALLGTMDKIAAGSDTAGTATRSLLSQVRGRVSDKRSWVSTRN